MNVLLRRGRPRYAYAAELPEEPSVVHKNALDPRSEILRDLSNAVESCAGENGSALLAQVGTVVANPVPDFDPRHYDFKRLSSLFEAIDFFDVQGEAGSSHRFMVWMKSAAKPAA